MPKWLKDERKQPNMPDFSELGYIFKQINWGRNNKPLIYSPTDISWLQLYREFHCGNRHVPPPGQQPEASPGWRLLTERGRMQTVWQPHPSFSHSADCREKAPLWLLQEKEKAQKKRNQSEVITPWYVERCPFIYLTSWTHITTVTNPPGCVQGRKSKILSSQF